MRTNGAEESLCKSA